MVVLWPAGGCGWALISLCPWQLWGGGWYQGVGESVVVRPFGLMGCTEGLCKVVSWGLVAPLEGDLCIQTKPGRWIKTREEGRVVTSLHFEEGVLFRPCWKRGLRGCLDYGCFTWIPCLPPPFFFFPLKMMGKSFAALLLPTETVRAWRDCRSMYVAAK